MAHRSVGHPVGLVIILKVKRWRHLDGPHLRAMTSLGYGETPPYTGTEISANLFTCFSGGNSFIQNPTTSSVPMPPKTTAGTVPIRAAVVPDSNSPNSLEAPMNSMETAETRPRITSGVESWIRLPRILTLTMSDAPNTNSASSDSGNQVERPNTMVAMPKTATAAN